MKKIILFMLSLMFATSIYAGDVARKGTTGADYLLIPVGARGIATGGSFVANLSGLESIYYNPAGLVKGSGAEFMFSYMNYIADINISYFGASTELGDFGSFRLRIQSEGADTLKDAIAHNIKKVRPPILSRQRIQASDSQHRIHQSRLHSSTLHFHIHHHP